MSDTEPWLTIALGLVAMGAVWLGYFLLGGPDR